MAILAFLAPIPPDKRPQWDSFMEEIRGPRRAAFNASRQRVGVHERTFLQETPMGDIVIVTLEGDDPMAALGQMAAADDDFTRWFIQQVQQIHGFDMRRPPENPPRLVIDSETT